MRLKNWNKCEVIKPFPYFAPNTHKLYILRHCINIVFILHCRNITLIHRRLYLKLYNKLYDYPLIAAFDIFCQQEVNWMYN